MKAERNYPRYTFTAKAEAAILRGHPWVYDAEITATEGQAENGGLVDVINKKGRYLGTGFFKFVSILTSSYLSLITPSGYSGSIFCSMKSNASNGSSPQFVGQLVTISTIEKPFPSI